MNNSEGKKIILTRQSISNQKQERSTASSSSNSRDYPSLPLTPNRFGPIAPSTSNSKPRPPYSALAQLQNLPKSPAIQKTITPPKPSSVILKTPSTTSSTTEYHINPNKQIIKILEPYEEQKLNQSFQSLIEYLYPKGSHFYINDYQTREYYQTILVDSGSVVIEHTPNPNNSNIIDFSKVKILKVITPEEWANKPYTYKTLSGYSSYPVYNYYDYQEAWFKAFLLRSFNHTWFFYFSDKFSSDYPRWFVKWFQYFGNIVETFPPKILEGFNKYKSYFSKENLPIFEYILQFTIIFKLPWIVLFTYKKQEPQDSSPPLLYRQFSVKWWKKINESQADLKAVTEYYNEYLSQTSTSSTPVPKLDDSEYIKRIQACTSKEDIQKILNEIKRSPTSSEDLFQDSQDPFADVILN